jgi:hypothetical protein
MTELDKFRTHFANKSKITQGVYNSNYKKLRELVQDEDIANVSQARIIDVVQDIDNRNSQQALINIAYLIRKHEGMPIMELETFRKKNQKLLQDKIYETNTNKVDSLPSYDTIVNYVDGLFEAKKYIQYVINYLLLYCQVRNADLIFDVVLYKKDASDTTKNYLWLNTRTKTVEYIRNVYKTARIVKPDGSITGYGQKIIKIIDPNFIDVMRILVKQQKIENKPIEFFPNTENMSYHIKKMTYQSLGETLYFKIVVNHFRTDPNMLKKISYNRGTDINTILNSYDIESQPITQ